MSALMAILGLVAYVPGLRLLGSLQAGFIPMAPSTAGCFLLLAAALLARTSSSSTTLRRALAGTMSALVLVFVGLELVGWLVGADLNMEDALVPDLGTLACVPVARMSPLTAALFMPAGLATFQGALWWPAAGIRGTRMALVFAALVVFGALTIQLGYFYETPILYGSGTIPMAATTAFDFLFIGGGALAAAASEDPLLGEIFGPAMHAKLMRAFVPVAVLGVVAAALVPNIFALWGVHSALAYALVASGTAAITAYVVSRAARTVGAAIDHAEAERELAEEARAALEQQLEQARRMEAIGRLAGGVAHDFNNILTGITGYAELVICELPEGSTLREDVEEILQAAGRAAGLTRQLLAFSRKQLIEPRLIELNQHIERTMNMLRRLVGEHIELVFTPAEGLWTIEADPTHLEQMLMNLVTNGRDAMPDGGTVRIATANRTIAPEEASVVSKLEPGDYVELCVTDEGAGMDEEVLKNVFEPFFTTKSRGRGTGLGLATVLGVVTQSGGHISVISAPGEGSTFTILLPRAMGVAASEARIPASEPSHATGTVLVVEDEDLVRALAQRILERQGYEVLLAADAAEAEQICRDHAGDIDLLLTDVILPTLNGRELYERITEIRPGLPALFMSGYTDDVLAPTGALGDKIDLLHKPFTASELTRRVHAAISR